MRGPPGSHPLRVGAPKPRGPALRLMLRDRRSARRMRIPPLWRRSGRSTFTPVTYRTVILSRRCVPVLPVDCGRTPRCCMHTPDPTSPMAWVPAAGRASKDKLRVLRVRRRRSRLTDRMECAPWWRVSGSARRPPGRPARRALKPPGLGRAVFPELPVAALRATLVLQGGNRDRPVGRPRIPSARWLRTFGSFRVGRAVATMMV